MAEPCSFEGETHVLDKPKGMTRDQCVPLNVKLITYDDSIAFMSCWKLTQEELDEVNRTGKIWLIVLSSMPPVIVSGIRLTD